MADEGHKSRSVLIQSLCSYSFFFFKNFVFGNAAAYGIFLPRAGMEPMSPAVEARGLNHRTAREVLCSHS